MLEIRKNSFSQNYENSFFRTFSKDLYKKFEQKNLEGVLIGSPFCSMDERLQIDALLITYNSICLIDFKNYGGKIILPNQQNFDNDSGLWTTEEGINIKGGSYNNPFIQLKRQKQRFINVFIDYIEKNLQSNDKCNPYHCIRLVCFHKEVELVGEIPGNHEKNFKILQKGNYLSGIVDILETTTSEIRLGKNSFNEFKRIFQADQYNLNEETNRDVFEEISAKESNLDFSILYEDQQEVLSKISDFIKNPQKQVFILQGTSNSGKSFLIPYIEKIAENSGIEEVLMFAQSKRVARNLMVNFNHENVNSIYSYIYGRNYIYDNNDYDKALINFCHAALFPGDEDKKIQLYLLMARCYYQLKQHDKCKFLSELIYLIVQKYDLKLTDEVSKIINHYQITYPTNEVDNPLREKQKQLIKIWKQDQLRDKKVFTGKIQKIHSNQKSGHLITDNNERYFFGMRDVQCNKHQLREGTTVEFFLKPCQNQQGNPEDHAVIIKII